MPVTVTVSEIRRALYHAAGMVGARGDGSPSTAVLGKWFHEGLGTLVGDSRSSPLARLSELDADLEIWKESLVAEAYATFVGPRLTSQQAALQDSAREVLAFWQAMQEACHWIAELNWQLRPARRSQRASRTPPWQTLADFLTTEEPLECVLHEPGWSDSVRLVGIADAVVRIVENGRWCAIELKLGQTSPAADLGQACLYHLILSKMARLPPGAADLPPAVAETGLGEHRRPEAAVAGALALISFRPERHEQLFEAHELSTARQRLLDLIGKMAGVVGPGAAPQATHGAPRANSFATDPATEPVTGNIRRAAVAAVPTSEHLGLGGRLVAALAEYGVKVSLDEPAVAGPTFLRFPVTLGRGTTVNAVCRHAGSPSPG